MLATGGVILTSAGALMISRSLELVKPIEFTHMKIGTGDISSLDSVRALTDLVASYMTINMSSIARNENTIRIRGSFTNESFSNEVTIKEIGVFAKIGAESVLFGYVNDGQGEVIPPGNSGNVISRTRDLYIGVTSEVEAVITIDKSLVYPTIEDLEEGLNQKENKFNKNSGFNKPKSDATNLKDSEALATSMAVAKTMEKAEEALNSAGGKEPAFNKNTAFNKNFGTGQNEILEGSKLAEILGIEYGGVLNNTNTKVAGKGYYDTANKKIYKCTANTSINYADSAYFEEISNNDLLGKFKNLGTLKTIYSDDIITIKECNLYYLVTSFRENTVEFTNNSTPTFNIPINLPRVHEYFGPIGSTPSKGGAYGKNNISVHVSKSGLTFYNGDWSATSTGKNYSTRFSFVLVKE